MTVIAWDGKTLAADKLGSNGNTKTTVLKIYRHEGELLGVTGNMSIGMEMLAWYMAGAKAADYPASNKDADKAGCSLVVIGADGSVKKYESGPHAFRMFGQYLAFGCGDEAALVAMHCGKTAAEAVEIACMFNSGCGNGVDTLALQ